MYKILMEVSYDLSEENMENIKKEYGMVDYLEKIKQEMKKAFELEKGFLVSKMDIKKVSDCCRAEIITVDVWNDKPRFFKCSNCGMAIY